MDNGRTVKIGQETHYPWDGNVKMTINPDQAAALQNKSSWVSPAGPKISLVPSDLYR